MSLELLNPSAERRHHNYAFSKVPYQSPIPGKGLWIWNSRPGPVPLEILIPGIGILLPDFTHVPNPEPSHVPKLHDLICVNMTYERASAFVTNHILPKSLSTAQMELWSMDVAPPFERKAEEPLGPFISRLIYAVATRYMHIHGPLTGDVMEATEQHLRRFQARAERIAWAYDAVKRIYQQQGQEERYRAQ